MNEKEKLLNAKIKKLESKIKLKDVIIENYEYKVKTGNWPKIDDVPPISNAETMLHLQDEKLEWINLKLENIELKEKLEIIEKGN